MSNLGQAARGGGDGGGGGEWVEQKEGKEGQMSKWAHRTIPNKTCACFKLFK